MSEASVSPSPSAAAQDGRVHKLALVDPHHTARRSGSEAIRVLIACRDGLVRAGLNALLNLEANIVVVGAAADGQQALDLARHLRPEVLLIDNGSPAIDGLQVTRRLTATGRPAPRPASSQVASSAAAAAGRTLHA